MKNKILIGSASLVVGASMLGILTALLASDPVIITRLSTVSGILGLGSVGLFFVGLVFPKQ